MSVLNEQSRRALSSHQLVFLTTLNQDGSAQVSAVWAGLEGDTIVIGHLMGGRKITNIERDPRVVVTLQSEGANELGMTNYLVVRGFARLQVGGAAKLLQHLAHGYLGADVSFPPMENPPAGHVIVVTPTRVSGVGPWTT